MNRYTVNGFTRISKSQARKLWAARVPVYACPCKLRPGRPWHPEAQRIIDRGHGFTFDRVASAVEYYGCTPETGRYLAYYVAEGVLPL